MPKWLRKIDDAIFSPPHRFETILAFVVLRLGLVFEQDSDQRPGQEIRSDQPHPKSQRPL